MTYDKDIFAKNLKHYMSLNNVTQAELSRLLNVSKASVSDWCNGKKFARMDKIQELACILHTSISSLTTLDAILGDEENFIIEGYRMLTDENKKKLNSYIRWLLHEEGEK